MAFKKIVCCCCSPPVRSPRYGLPVSVQMGTSPFSPMGISPFYIQSISPDQYFANQDRYDREEPDGGRRKLYSPDPLHPEDPRSQCSALTPKFRGEQNGMLNYFDKYSDHSPAGVSVTFTSWDGVTTMSPCFPDTYNSTQIADARSAIMTWLFPAAGGAMRGIKQLYDSVLPFADPADPTPIEFENWNVHVINLARALLGLSSMISNHEDMFLKAAFAHERCFTDIWDSYPGNGDFYYGPCDGTQFHCGFGFTPNLSDQKAYWNDNYCSQNDNGHSLIVGASAEGIFTPSNTNAFLQISKLMSFGIDGHTPSFYQSSGFGYHYYVEGTADLWRVEWSGSVNLCGTGFKFLGF